MADPKTVSPYACKPLLEEIAATPETTAAAFTLPASFPAELLTEEQLDEVQTWFDSWCADLLHAVRSALVGDDTAAAQTLAHLQQRAVLLAHLLRLHPAAEASTTQLATALGISRRTAFYMQENILQHVKPALRGTTTGGTLLASFTTQLAAIGTLLPDAAAQLSPRCICVPFKPHVHLAHRFATVQAVATHPAVASAREDFMPGTTKNAILITLKHS